VLTIDSPVVDSSMIASTVFNMLMFDAQTDLTMDLMDLPND